MRDIAAGLSVLVFMAWGTPRGVGMILLVDALIPIGDMLTILVGKGSRATAFGVHGVTAAFMLFAGFLMVLGAL